MDYFAPLTKQDTKNEFDVSHYDLSSIHVCKSDENDLKTFSVFNGNDYQDQLVFLANTDGIFQAFRFVVDEIVSDKSCRYTCYNGMNEPIMSGIYDVGKGTIETTDIYGNTVVLTKKAVATWGCGLAIGLCGAIWSTALGMVSAGAGFVAGMAYTALGIAAC